MTDPDWTCEAYGPDVRDVGAVCFFAGELHKRVCASHAECRERMTAERQRVFDRIQERAAEGDPDMAYLAEVFTDPSQLLGGSEVTGSSEEGNADE